MTRKISVLVLFPDKKKICQQNNVSQTSATTETSAVAFQKIELEQKWVDQRNRRENASVQHKNASIPDKNDNKDERAKIVSEDRDKSKVADLEHQIQHFKAKA